MTQTGLPARRTAHHMLMEITTEGRLMAELIVGGALNHLANDDRARAQRLTTAALRGLDRADRMLKPHLKKTPPDITMTNPTKAMAMITRIRQVRVSSASAASP